MLRRKAEKGESCMTERKELGNVPATEVLWNIWNKDASRLLAQVTAQTAFAAYKRANLTEAFSELHIQQVPGT